MHLGPPSPRRQGWDGESLDEPWPIALPKLPYCQGYSFRDILMDGVTTLRVQDELKLALHLANGELLVQPIRSWGRLRVGSLLVVAMCVVVGIR